MYISPLDSFPELSDPSNWPLDRTILLRIRKKYLAELELGQTVSLKIGNNEWTKQSIISAFDGLEADNTLQYHQAVSADPVLKSFLSGEGLARPYTFGVNILYSDPDFLSWVSPYFLHALKNMVYSCIREHDPDYLYLLLGNTLLCTADDYSRAVGLMDMLLNERAQTIEKLTQSLESGDKTLMHKAEIAKYVSSSWTALFNRMPEYLLYAALETYAVAAINFGAALINRKQKSLGAYVCKAIEFLKCSEENTRIIKSNLAVATASGSSRGGASYWWIGIVIIALVRMILTGDRCNRSSNYRYNLPEIPSSQFQYTPQIQDPEIDSILKLQQSPDSLRKSLQKVFQDVSKKRKQRDSLLQKKLEDSEFFNNIN